MKYLPKPAVFFLCAALVSGILITFLIPPFQSPDEPGHFFRACQVSQGDLLPEKTADRRLGGVLPASLAQVADSFAYLKNDYAARTSAAQIRRISRIPLRAGDTRFTDFANTAFYAPTAYIPQALAIALLRPLGATPLELLYACRLFNLLTWCILVFAAIRRMPQQKWTMTGIALLPASLVMAASCNADVLTNGLCFWLISDTLNGMPARLPARAAAMVMVVCNKIITASFLLLLFYPGDRRRQWGLALVTLLAATGWGIWSSGYFIPYDLYHPAFRDTQTLNEGVAPLAQLQWEVAHPIRFAGIVVRSVWHAVPSAAAHLAGKFGWEKNYLPGPVTGLLWLALLALCSVEHNPASVRKRALAAAVSVLYVMLFAMVMFALWCPVGAPEITNWQGRYFVPLLPLLALSAGKGWMVSWQKWVIPLSMATLVLAGAWMLAAIAARYYGL